MSQFPDSEQSVTGKTARSYNQLAAKYDSHWIDYLEHTHRLFLEQITISRDDMLLDLSCGTGLLAEYIIKRDDSFKKLILNDVAADMQQIARNRLADHGNIQFTSYSAEAIPFQDATFNKIFCLNAFHNYNHPKKVLAACFRVLKPEGQLFVLDWNRSGWFRIINKFIKLKGLEHIATRSAGEMKRALKQQGFTLFHKDEWYFRYWKLFYLIARKTAPKDGL